MRLRHLTILQGDFYIYTSRARYKIRIEVAEKFPILPLRNSEKFPILCIENT